MNTVKKIIPALLLLISFHVQATAPPSFASFTVSNDTVCPGDSIVFTNTSTGAVSYSWDFGDFSNPKTTQHAKHAYSYGGSFIVNMIAWDGAGIPDTAQAIIFVKNKPSANFTVYKTNACMGEPIQIGNYSTMFDSIRWFFGDGTTSSQTGPSLWHMYNSIGSKLIRQNVYLNGCKDTMINNSVYITVSKNYSISGNTNTIDSFACPGRKINFELYDGDSSVKSVLWRFTPVDSSKKEITDFTFTIKGTYTVTVKATNYCNFKDSAKFIINITDTITPKLIAGDFGFWNPSNPYPPLMDSIAVCPNDTVYFDFLATNYQSIKTKWFFGDGQSDSSGTVKHVYSSANLYIAKLVITNDCGNKDSGYVKVNVTNTLPAKLDTNDVYVSNPSACPNQKVYFNLFNSSGKYKTPLWKFGDGASSASLTPSHTYSVTGTYTATVRITNNCSKADSVKVIINIVDTIKPDLLIYDYGAFDSQPNYDPVDTVCKNKPIHFKFYSYYYPEHTFKWYFGDGDSSAQAEPLHAYTSNGVYTAKLILKNLCGKSDTGTITITVTDTLTPKASLITSRTDTVCFGDNILFSAYGGDTYTWNFGDATPAETGQEVKHFYSSPGTYTVTLSASNTCGKSSQAKHVVNVGNNGTINFDISISRQEACPGDTILFTPTDDNFTSYYWNFGDGATSTQVEPGHAYSASGNYPVYLVATNACGKKDTVYYSSEYNYININTTIPPYSSFTFASPVCAHTPVKFFNNSLSADFGFSSDSTLKTFYTSSWKFGDGKTSALKEPVHTYKAPGTYSVQLVVTNNCGKKDTMVKTITVTGPAKISGQVTWSGGNVNVGKVYAFWQDTLPFEDTVMGVAAINNGNYIFDSLPQGKFILKAVADTNTYPTLTATYADSTFFWDSASVVMSLCNTTILKNIRMLEEQPLSQPGTLLRGLVAEDSGFVKKRGNPLVHAPGEPVPDIDVKLGKKPSGQFFASTTTDGSLGGYNYQFSGVPYGDYIVYVDVPGLGLVGHYEITVSPTSTTIYKLDYWIDSTKIDTIKNNTSSIKKITQGAKQELTVYPNPSRDQMTVVIEPVQGAMVKLEAYNILGEKLHTIYDSRLTPGRHTFRLRKSDLNGLPGIYFIKCSIGDHIYTERILFTD